MVERPVGVPKNQASPLGASGNSPQSNAMMARPSSTTCAVRTSFAPRGWMRRSSTNGQLTISSAGKESLVASAAHASSARAMTFFRCSVGQFSSNVIAKSETAAHTRQDDTASDSHGVFASPLAWAASMRYLRKTPTATSYAQKPRSAYVTGCVWLTKGILRTGACISSRCEDKMICRFSIRAQDNCCNQALAPTIELLVEMAIFQRLKRNPEPSYDGKDATP